MIKRVLVFALLLGALGIARADASPMSSRDHSYVWTDVVRLREDLYAYVDTYRSGPFHNAYTCVALGSAPATVRESDRWACGRGEYSFESRRSWKSHVTFGGRTNAGERVTVDLYWNGAGTPDVRPFSYTTYSLLRPVVVGAYARRPAAVRGGITVDGRSYTVRNGGGMELRTPLS